jgi:ABC-type polysaccharide/polyol phosphate export permease
MGRGMSATPFSIEYDSAKARSTIVNELRDLYRYRDFLRLLVSKTIKSRYKRSVLGIAWTLLNPLVSMVVMSIAFSALFRAAIPRYPVYLLVGLTAWNFFSQSTAFAMGQLFWGGSLMKRVYLPPTIFAVASIANGLVNIAFSLVPLLAIMLVLGQPLYATWWFFPIAVAILAVFSLGVALLVSSIAALFVDVMEMYQLLLQALFFLTPIIYPLDVVPERYAWALAVNPMYYMVEIVRRPVYEGRLPAPGVLLAAVVLAVASLLLGAWVFTRKADELAYRI